MAEENQVKTFRGRNHHDEVMIINVPTDLPSSEGERAIHIIRGGKNMNFETDIFSVFNKRWALLTAGNKENFNTMTVSWGGLGTIWGKPVATVYVRTSRYTHEFMDREDYFTVSFYPEECRKVLGVLGSKSGRDMDKMKNSGLTAKELSKSMTFKEAEVTLVCRKLFMQRLEPSNILDPDSAKFYEGDAPHDMYIGEVVEIINENTDSI